MFRKRLFLVLLMGSVLLASLLISSFTLHASPLYQGKAGGLYWQQVSWNGSLQATHPYRLDCFKRYYIFDQKDSSAIHHQDASNFFMNLS